MSDAEQIDEFCSALLGGPDGTGDDRLDGLSTYVWTLDHGKPKPIKRTLWSPAHQPGSLASSLRSTVARQPGEIAAVYLSMGLVPNHLVQAKIERNQRASNTEIAGIPALWADLDIAGPNHKDQSYPPNEAAAKRVLAEVGVPPSIILHTGGGLQAYWLFNEPWLIADGANPDAERRAMAALSRDLTNTLRFHAHRLGGWKIDSTFDLARVMRAPGSYNTKTDPAREVRIVHLDRSCRYEPDEIREGLAGTEELAEFLTSQTAGGVTVAGAASIPGVDLHKAWEHVRAAPEHTPEWLRTLLDPDMATDALLDTWEGKREDLNNDQSAIDAALVRLLIGFKISPQQQAEAIMARRLHGDHKVDKIDPAKRQDYIVRTLVNIQNSATRALQEREARTSVTASVIASAASARLGSASTPAASTARPAPKQVEQQPAARPALRSVPEPKQVERPASEPEPDDEPAPEYPDEDDDDFGDYVTDLVKPDPVREPEPEPTPEQVEAARDQVRAENPATAEVPKVAISPKRERPDFRERSPEQVQLMGMLANLLLPDPYRERGVLIWEVQARDRGPEAMGRVVLRFPNDFDWPGGARPETYRPNLPFHCAWFKRSAFETPIGFQRSVIYDAKIPALPVGSNKEDWNQLITALVPYWQPDSSGSDLTTQVVTWLLEYLVGRPPTQNEDEAALHARPFLRDHAEWGTRGAPTVFVHQKSLFDYIGTQPGGPMGRKAQELMDHMHVTPQRIRLTDNTGKQHRASWLLIDAAQFERSEWDDVLTAAQEAADGRERRNLKLMKGGA